MVIQQNSTPDVVFLLVRERDGITGIEGAQGITCTALWPGQDAFAPIVLTSLRTFGGGWYSITLPAEATAKLGQVVVVAKSNDSYEWRDIHQVVAPVTTAGGCSCNEVAAVVGEALAALPPTPDVDAVVSAVLEQVAVDAKLVAADPVEPPPVDPPKPNLVPKPIGEWALHCGGEITRMVSPDGATFRRQGASQSNCQTYTVQAMDAGMYRLSFAASATIPMTLGLALQQHQAPYNKIGLDAEANITEQQGGFHFPFAVQADEPNARLRFWLGDIPDGGDLRIENVRIERQN